MLSLFSALERTEDLVPPAGSCEIAEGPVPVSKPSNCKGRIIWRAYYPGLHDTLANFVRSRILRDPSVRPSQLHREIVEAIGECPSLTKEKVNARKQYVILNEGLESAR